MNTTYSHDQPFVEKLNSIGLQISQKKLKEAALTLNRLVKAHGTDPRLFLLGARLSEAAGNPEGMLGAARKAHQLAPHWATATFYLASVLANRDEAEEALSLAEQAVVQAFNQATPPGNDPEFLVNAAALAQLLDRPAQALQWLRQAEQSSPDEPSIGYKIGLTLAASGDPAGAVETFNRLLVQQPDNAALLSARMQACLSTLETDQAIKDGEALVAMDANDELYSFYLSIARGDTPATLPERLVTSLFDGYAGRFDRQWVVKLHYKLPRDVAKLIQQWYPDRKVDVLDLGCGTGLLGLYLGALDGVLVGVDLSENMIIQAHRHQVYDSFHKVNLLDALRDTPENSYRVITALDVFNYVGSLDLVVSNAHRILEADGRFVFSCEAGTDLDSESGPGYVLQRMYRYTHQLSYLKKLLDTAGFKEVSIENCVLRTQDDLPVQGFLVIAQKSSVASKKIDRKPPKNAKPASLLQ